MPSETAASPGSQCPPGLHLSLQVWMNSTVVQATLDKSPDVSPAAQIWRVVLGYTFPGVEEPGLYLTRSEEYQLS